MSRRARHRHLRRTCSHLTVVTALALAAGCDATDRPTAAEGARVVRVVDGDTIVVRSGGRTETVRLIGVDTPETVRPDSPVECYGPEASALTRRLLPDGTPIRLSRDVEARDDYGRLLAYVHRAADGLFVNVEIAARGAARPLTIPPNTTAAAPILAAARDAEAADLGLWAACNR